MKKKKKTVDKRIPFDLITKKIMEFGNQTNIQPNKLNTSRTKNIIPTPRYEIDLIKILKKYHPLDVFQSLLIAESWIPNIDHFIKFSLSFEIFFTIPEKDFTNNRIDNYQDFKTFLEKIFRLLPCNPMVEDFYPVGDWGEVKYQFEGKTYQILYGSPLSDTYGFIKGFEICYSSNKEALRDFKQIITIQNSLISVINTQNLDKNSEGKLEVPSEIFRQEILCWLENFDFKDVNSDLVVESGNPRNSYDFYERYLNAQVNPYCFYKYKNKIYPFSLRNHIPVIVEYYYSKETIAVDKVSLSISNFLEKNIDNLLCGSFKVRNQSNILPYNFSGTFQSKKNTYFIMSMSMDELTNIQSIKKNLRHIMNNPNWAIQKLYFHLGLQPRNVDGEALNFENTKFIIVLKDLTTLPKMLRVKFDKNLKFISIYDFVSIVDSLQSKDELDHFIDFFDLYTSKSPFLNFNLDSYASYHESYGLLEDGAINFNFIHVDKHTAHYFKYKSLKEMYSELIDFLPNSDNNWIVKKCYDGNYCFLTKNCNTLAWSTTINNFQLNFLFDFIIINNNLSELNPKVIELFCEAATDAFSQRKSLLSSLSFKKNISFKIKIGNMIKSESNKQNYNFYIKEEKIHNSADNLIINLYLDLNYCFELFQSATDAGFQADICIKIIQIINKYITIENLTSIILELNKTRLWPLRMTMGYLETLFDIVEKKPKKINEYRFKLARQKIAYILKNQDIEPNKYTDEVLAKSIINSAADELRSYIHNIIKNRNTISILEIVLDDYSALVTDNYINNLKQQQSLKHEVSYNRAERLADLDSDFKRHSQNHRYLIECSLMLINDTDQKITEDEYLDLLAHIHWLLNLYHYSDSLHFGIGVEGINIDSTYIPEIFIPESIVEIENEFLQELSSYNLGIGLNSDDELESIISKNNYQLINKAFYQDLEFSFINLLTVLYCLSNWASINKITPQSFYKENFQILTKSILNNITIDDISLKEVESIINFLTLDIDKINQLEGIDGKHYDVPVGDHNKRTNRINIKPLINLDGKVLWSPACTYRSLAIWKNHPNDGYLPADFNFPNVNDLVNKSKTALEKQLETKAYNVLARRTEFIECGIDLKKKFKKEQYPDIGDYDVLAYFPHLNSWVMIECKYNQPAYCQKDMSRLRQKIFGKNKEDKKSHISKVEGRYNFLIAHYNKIRESLKWPIPQDQTKVKIINLYVSKNTYWWFRYPPYQVDVDFVQIDFLEEWLKINFDR